MKCFIIITALLLVHYFGFNFPPAHSSAGWVDEQEELIPQVPGTIIQLCQDSPTIDFCNQAESYILDILRQFLLFFYYLPPEGPRPEWRCRC